MSDENEVWKDIPGYPNRKASNLGRIRHLRTNEITSGYKVGRYLCVAIGKRHASVHSLVMLAFVGAKPEGMEINHKDGNRFNNHPSNLEYVTHQQNMSHAQSNGLYRSGARHHLSKLDNDKVREMRRAYASGEISQRQLAERYGVSDNVICLAINRKTWKHVD